MKNLWSNYVETPKNLLNKYLMKNPIKSEVSIEVSIFNDWRDWFLTEEDKKINSLMLTNLYIDNDIAVGRDLLIPRNFLNLSFLIVLELAKNTIVSKIILEIPKMKVLEKRNLDRLVYTQPGDKLTINFQFSRGEITNAS